MPLFAVFFSGVMGALASFLAQFMARKVAVVTASLASLSVITTTLMVAFNAIVSPLVAQMFSTQYGQFIGLAFPPVAGTCMASYGTCWAACTLYRWQLQALSMTVQA